MHYEGRINEALRQLGEEHRLGMVKAEEFRNRRRALLASWGERDATTSPGGKLRSASTTQTNPASRRHEPATPASRNSLPIVAVVVAVIVVAGVAAGWMLTKGATGGPAVAQRSAGLTELMRDANAFRNRNRWEAEDTQEFLLRWRALSAEERRQAQQEPSLQSLRYELEQNIKAERQALELGPNADGQARLDRLVAFAAELSGNGS